MFIDNQYIYIHNNICMNAEKRIDPDARFKSQFIIGRPSSIPTFPSHI